jgi:hypothetical protein
MNGSTEESKKLKSDVLERSLVRAILFSIISAQGEVSFKHTCNSCTVLFGEPNSLLRKRARDRRYKLLKLREEYPLKFDELCRDYGLDHIYPASQIVSEVTLSQLSTMQSTPNKAAMMLADSPLFRPTVGK